MSNSTAYWLTAPCPPWCEREHHDDDFTEHRIHRPADDLASVLLTANDPIRLPNKVAVIRYSFKPVNHGTTNRCMTGSTRTICSMSYR